MDGNFKAQLKDKLFDIKDGELIIRCYFPDVEAFRKFLAFRHVQDDVSPNREG